MAIICVISTFFVNNVGFYFLTFDDRLLGLLIEFLSNNNKKTLPAIPKY